MIRTVKLPLMVSLILLLSATCLYAGGLSSHFVEEKMDNLRPGETYSVKANTGKALVVQNTTKDITVDIAIEPEKPVDYNTVPGYEPIPDLSWVKIDKNYFEKVKPGDAIKTDISISIPTGNKYYGKKYQVYLYSHTAGEGTFRVGIMGRILLNMAPAK